MHLYIYVHIQYIYIFTYTHLHLHIIIIHIPRYITLPKTNMTMEKLSFLIGDTSTHSWLGFPACHVSFRGCIFYMDVSKNRGTPKSSILIGFSIINHPFWGTPIFGNSHIQPDSYSPNSIEPRNKGRTNATFSSLGPENSPGSCETHGVHPGAPEILVRISLKKNVSSRFPQENQTKMESCTQ